MLFDLNLVQPLIGPPKFDVAWGPTPILFDTRPVGDTHAWEIVWGVKVCVPECDAAQYKRQIMAFNYDVRYAQDAGGYTHRTVSGSLEIPLTRKGAGNRGVPETVDEYTNKILVECPAGFRQTSFDRTVSMDRRRLEFTCTQEQLPGPVPPLGILRVKLGNRTQNVAEGNLVNWVYVIDADVEMASGQLQDLAYKWFLAVVDRKSVV